MLIGHLSDLHLRDAADVIALERQLDRIAARHVTHLALTGDLLDRWNPRLFERVLDALAARGFAHADRLTILHGNHDLASSGGHPRRPADLWRLGLRFWDPPPLISARRRAFYDAIARRARDVGASGAWVKRLGDARLAVIDSVPVHWRPVQVARGAITVRHAIGCVRTSELRWLEQQRSASPLVLLLHHYPLDAPQFRWTPSGPRARGLLREVLVPMAIPPPQRQQLWTAASAANVRLVLCGHVHRARLEWKDGIAVGLNGESGAAWAGRTIAFYEVTATDVRAWCERCP